MEWYWILTIVVCSLSLLLLLSVALYRVFFKRFWDVVLSGISILLLSPVFIVLIVVGAIAMKGNPFFLQPRPGKKEKVFYLIKFRSMNNKKDGNGVLLPDKQRLSKYGAFLRATSLDELPELFNIFAGNMSIVGPRPLLVKYLPFYTEQQRHRHDVRPGLTGYAQAHGRNGIDWDSKLEMDLWYVGHVSLLGDLRIVFDTVFAVLKREGINQEGQATMEDFSEYVKIKRGGEAQMANKGPLISVIVPIYGIEKYVGVCVESIISQTYTNLEIILVDDGSPDKCGEICDLYAKKDSRIKVIHKKNGGLVSARKAGIQIAKGEYATYVDGDDWIERDYYRSLVEQIDDSDVVVSGHKRTLFEKAVDMPLNFAFGQYQGEELDKVKKRMISYGRFFKTGVSTYVWNKLFKTELLKKYQMLVDDDITIGEDAAVVYPLMNGAKKILFANVFGYMYRQRDDSMLKKTKPFSEELNGLRKLYDYLSLFAKNNPGYEYDKQVNDFILGICIIRSGGIKLDKSGTLPFRVDFERKNIAIYSAGTFGQQLVRRIEENGYCQISCWVDDDYCEYRRCSLEVDPIGCLNKKRFDYLVIATIDTDLAEGIKNQLIKIGIEENKILSVECEESSRHGLLKEYLGDRNQV